MMNYAGPGDYVQGAQLNMSVFFFGTLQKASRQKCLVYDERSTGMFLMNSD